jgi:hypothetical protein
MLGRMLFGRRLRAAMPTTHDPANTMDVARPVQLYLYHHLRPLGDSRYMLSRHEARLTQRELGFFQLQNLNPLDRLQ